MMRSRKSRDSGAGMTSPPTHQNPLPRISIPDSAQHKSALGFEPRLAESEITKRVVDGATPGPATYLIRDAELKGFVLVVTQAGAKSYAVDYRAGGGRRAPKRRYTIGKHGSPWTPEQARREAAKLLGDVARG